MKSKYNDQDRYDKMRSDPDNYILGLFYFNSRDPRIILPKRNPYLGWTLNFANPFSFLFILLIIASGIIIDKLFS